MGGAPEFDQPLVVGRPNLGDTERFMSRMEQIIASRRFSNNGPFVREFEARIGQLTGARNCVATCNATIGLELTINALGLTGSVIVPSFTFIATAHVIERCGLTPLFCDVDPRTHTIAPDNIEGIIRRDTSAILGVHLWGRACPVEEFEALAKRHGLRLLFDAAHAFGSSYRGKPIGTFGDAEVFSFHATKAINSFEGGAIATNDDRLAAKLREMVNFGQDTEGKVVRLGTNAKMSEPCAAMGLTSIEAMEAIFEHNRLNLSAYLAGLEAVPGVRVLEPAEDEVSNYQFVVVEVDARTFGMTRDELNGLLEAENVVARRYFYPSCHMSEPYRGRLDSPARSLPATERLSASVLCLPTGASVSTDDAARICRIIAVSAHPASELKAILLSGQED